MNMWVTSFALSIIVDQEYLSICNFKHTKKRKKKKYICMVNKLKNKIENERKIQNLILIYKVNKII